MLWMDEMRHSIILELTLCSSMSVCIALLHHSIRILRRGCLTPIINHRCDSYTVTNLFSNRHHLSYLSICSHLTLTLTYCIEGCECCSSQAAHTDAAGVPARVRGRSTRRALPRTTTGRHRARYPSKPEHAPRRRRRSCGPHRYSCCNTVEDHHTGAE
jgi:hypothetical protein